MFSSPSIGTSVRVQNYEGSSLVPALFQVVFRNQNTRKGENNLVRKVKMRMYTVQILDSRHSYLSCVCTHLHDRNISWHCLFCFSPRREFLFGLLTLLNTILAVTPCFLHCLFQCFNLKLWILQSRDYLSLMCTPYAWYSGSLNFASHSQPILESRMLLMNL